MSELGTPVEPGKYGWIDFDADEADEIPGKYMIEIFSTDEAGRYEEELAVIVHRTCDGKYPLDGDLANEKRARAQRIVDALNATVEA